MVLTTFGAHPLPRCTSRITILANCTDSLIVAVSLGEGLIGSPRSLIAATRQAAMSSAPAWRSGSMREGKHRRTIGESQLTVYCREKLFKLEAPLASVRLGMYRAPQQIVNSVDSCWVCLEIAPTDFITQGSVVQINRGSFSGSGRWARPQEHLLRGDAEGVAAAARKGRAFLAAVVFTATEASRRACCV